MDYLQRNQPNIQLGVITKGRAENELKQRLDLERISIPFVLVLNDQFQPVGRFIEQPRAVIDGGNAVKPDYRAGEYLESTVQDFLDILRLQSDPDDGASGCLGAACDDDEISLSRLCFLAGEPY